MMWSSIITQAVALTLTFFFGRFSAYHSDRLSSLKDINDNFLKPFLSLYNSTIHLSATDVNDIPNDKLIEMLRFLNDNKSYLPPELKTKISELDMILSEKYSIYGDPSVRLSVDDTKYVNRLLPTIVIELDKMQKKITRKLYCSPFERLSYWFSEKREAKKQKKSNNSHSKVVS